MEYRINTTEDDHTIRHYDCGSSRDWFAVDKFAAADDSSDLMDASPLDYHYENINVRRFSDISHHHQTQQLLQHNYAQPQTLGLGIGEQIRNIQREHMFDKVVTPSDVGKLNRLVIPKPHAEKYFPLDSSSNEKGLLLNFEDLTGKSWRFRYSYWNSSQSYVMTKGWSRFVKEKKLDAGDIVSFQRGVGEAEKHRLFIDWRRRPVATPSIDMSQFHNQFYRSSAGSGIPSSWSPMSFGPPPNRVLHPSFNFQTHHHQSSNNYYGYGISTGRNYMGQVVTNNASVVYLTSPDQGIGMAPGGGGGGIRESVPVVFESVPVVQGKKMAAAAVAKKLRLFGVNMECGPISSDNSTTDEYEIHSSISPNAHLSQYPSSSTTLFLPSSSTRMYDDGTRPVSNKGKMSMSLDLDI